MRPAFGSMAAMRDEERMLTAGCRRSFCSIDTGACGAFPFKISVNRPGWKNS